MGAFFFPSRGYTGHLALGTTVLWKIFLRGFSRASPSPLGGRALCNSVALGSDAEFFLPLPF